MPHKQQEEARKTSPSFCNENNDDTPVSGQTTPRRPSPPLSDTQSYITALESPVFSVVGSDEEYNPAVEDLTDSTHDTLGDTTITNSPTPIITFSPSSPQPPSTDKPKGDEELSSTSRAMLSRIARLIPLTRSVVERSNDFDNCENAENGLQNQQQSLEDNLEEDLPGQDPYGDEDEDLAIRPLNENEMALTGANVITGLEKPRNPTITATCRGAEAEVTRLPIINRRAHAIPIRAPPSPRRRRLVLLPAFQHGLAGVPSHYVPLQGPLTGMFFDPVTRMYIGDGPPRSTAHRSDRTVPTTLTREQVNMETVPEEPVNIDDMVHVQSREQIKSIEDEADERSATNPQPGQVPFDLSYTPTSVPTRPYEAYWCHCRQMWLSYQHGCPEPPTPAFPTTMPIRPGSELPADWITHRIVVDTSIYPGAVVSKETPAAAASSCAVEGEYGSDIPARWFAPGPSGFDISPMAEVLQSEAADSEAAYDNLICPATTEGVSVAQFPTIPYTHFPANPYTHFNNALYPPTHIMHNSNLEDQLAVPVSPYDNDPRSGSETEVPTKRNRRNKRTGHRGRADKNQAHADQNDETKVAAYGGNHKVRGDVKEKQAEPKGNGKEFPTKEGSGAVSAVEKGKQPEHEIKAKEMANEEKKADEDARQSEVAPGKPSKPKSNPAGPTNPKVTTEKDEANFSEVKRGKRPEARSQTATIVPPETTSPLSFQTDMIVTTPQELRAIVASPTAKQPSTTQQTWSTIAQSQSPKKPTPAAPAVEKKAKSHSAAADDETLKTKNSVENEWTEVVSSGTKKAHKSGHRGGKDSGKPNPRGPKGG